MEYYIGNVHRKVYCRLDDSGVLKVCPAGMAQMFELSKAQNLLKSLPKQLKKFHLTTIAVSDFQTEIGKQAAMTPKEKRRIERAKPKPENTISHTYYSIPPEILEWAERAKSYGSLPNDLLHRKEELVSALSNIDRKRSNLCHQIRFEKPRDACTGYKRYRQMKEIEDTRGLIKDELDFVSFLLGNGIGNISPELIEAKVKDLQEGRYFVIRSVEEGGEFSYE